MLSSILFLLSCRDKKTTTPVPSVDTLHIIKEKVDTIQKFDGPYYWDADFRGKKGWVMTKTQPVNPDSLSVTAMIDRLNGLYPDVWLRYIRTSNDTVFLKVKNGRYLANQMGTAGSEAYIGAATYNITEVAGINYVAFSFKPGAHIEPGVYSRTDFIHGE